MAQQLESFSETFNKTSSRFMRQIKFVWISLRSFYVLVRNKLSYDASTFIGQKLLKHVREQIIRNHGCRCQRFYRLNGQVY